MWRSDQTDDMIDDDEVIKPSNSNNNNSNTLGRNNSNVLKQSKMQNDQNIINNEEVLQRRKRTNHRMQAYGERERFLPQIAWKRALFMALCQGHVPMIENIIFPHNSHSNIMCRRRFLRQLHTLPILMQISHFTNNFIP